MKQHFHCNNKADLVLVENRLSLFEHSPDAQIFFGPINIRRLPMAEMEEMEEMETGAAVVVVNSGAAVVEVNSGAAVVEAGLAMA